jgi:tetratricopeptide (TPR) repeat protein
VFWIDCSTNQTIEQGFSKIAQRCNIKDELQSIRTWLSNMTEQWLLIFDNADDPAIDISLYFPVGSRGTILITTRNPDCKVHQTVGSYEFAGMGVEDAVDLLLKTTGMDDLSLDTSRGTARNIVTTLGNLALAIIQAGAAIRQNLCQIEDYCDMYRRRRQELLSRAPTQASSDYKYTVYTTWEVSVHMIEGMSTEVASHALDLLRLFSFLHFDGISEEIFREAWENMEHERCLDWTASNQVSWLHEDTSEWDPYRVRESVILLSSFSLIKVDGSSNNISMHPLVHTWAHDRLDTAEQRQWLLITASILATSISWENKTSDYRFRKSLVSHIMTCLKSLTPEILFAVGNGEEERLEVANKFIRVCVENGQWQDAVELKEKVLEATKRTLGEEHPDTLLSMGNLASSYSDVGRRQEAIELEEKVLEARTRTLREEHPDTLISIGNLARSYSDVGRRQEAIELEEKVLEARKRTLGEEHPDTLLAIGNLARSYSDVGRRQEADVAIELEEKVLEATKRTLGEEHPDTLLSISSLEFDCTNIHEQTHPQNPVLRSTLQSEPQVEGKSRSRWNLRSLVKRSHR